MSLYCEGEIILIPKKNIIIRLLHKIELRGKNFHKNKNNLFTGSAGLTLLDDGADSSQYNY
jgi:hypothetical protein